MTFQLFGTEHLSLRSATQMDLTELAHWEYRCVALDESVRKIEAVLRQVRSDRFFAEDEHALSDQLDYERWLLEEARYNVTLGRWQQAVAATANKNVEFLDELKRQIHYNKHNLGELGTFIRLAYVDNIIDEQKQRLLDAL